MIYVGFPCIGKSSICGGQNIDLESSNTMYNPDGMGYEYVRDDSWVEVYCNFAIDLNRQGFNVFVSSHSDVVEHLNSLGVHYTAIFPSLELKGDWIKRARQRYETTRSDKNFRALHRIEQYYEQDITQMMNICSNKILITNIDYDLRELL